MRTRTKSFLSLLGVCLAGAWTVACGSGSTSETIGSPDSALGAAIQGRVTVGSGSGGSTFGFGAAIAPSTVRVSVVGSSQSTTTDNQGRFSLTGLPGGTATLRFQTTGTDARLTLGGLVEGQVLTIDVHVSGSDATLASDRDEFEFTGTVEAVGTTVLVVSGVTVVVTPATEIKRGDLEIALADIQVGETAKVEGERNADGVVLAREIKLSGGTAPDGGEVEFEGVVEAVTPPSLVVSGRNVLTDSQTEFKGKGKIHSVADLNVGDVVEVEGLEATPGTVLALEIKRIETAGDDDDDDDDEDEEDEDEDDDDDDEDEDDDDNSGSGS